MKSSGYEYEESPSLDVWIQLVGMISIVASLTKYCFKITIPNDSAILSQTRENSLFLNLEQARRVSRGDSVES